MTYSDSLVKLPLKQAINRLGRYAKRRPVRTAGWLAAHPADKPPGNKMAMHAHKRWVRQARTIQRWEQLARLRRKEISA